MSDYFKFFPKTIHTNRTVIDITKRTKILEEISTDPYVFLPYTVSNDDRPEHIAEFYYGDVNKVWLVYFANNIIDLYSQWPLSANDFDENFKKKYEELSGTTGFSVIAWGQNELLTDNVVYYQNIANEDLKINLYTYSNSTEIVSTEWRAIRYYEYENILNDNKRNIYLIDSRYADKFENDLKVLLNE